MPIERLAFDKASVRTIDTDGRMHAGVVITRDEARNAGLKRFFSGEPCKRGHLSERTIHNSECLECHNEARREGRAAKRSAIPLSPRAAAKAAGLTRYFTGDPCKRGHIAERNVKSLACSACQAEKDKDRRDTHRGGPARPQIAKAQAKSNRLAGLRYCHDCKETKPISEFHVAASRPDGFSHRCRLCMRAWRKENRDIILANHANRRARKLGSGGKHDADDIAFLEKTQGNKCANPWCRVSLKKIRRNIDHIMPLAKGGSNDRRNLQLLCQPCNNHKHAKHPIDFAQEHGMLL